MYYIKSFFLKFVNIFTDKSQKTTAAQISYQKTHTPLPKKCELSVKIQQIWKRTEYHLIWKHKHVKLTYLGVWASMSFKVDTWIRSLHNKSVEWNFSISSYLLCLWRIHEHISMYFYHFSAPSQSQSSFYSCSFLLQQFLQNILLWWF